MRKVGIHAMSRSLIRIKQTGNKHKGCAGEYYAMYDACKKGYLVGKISESDLLGYDLVMDDGEKLYRVEVKTSDISTESRRTGMQPQDRVKFNLTRRNSTNSKYDYVHWFALFSPKLKKIAWIRYQDIEGRKSKKTITYKEFELYQLPENTKLKYLILDNIDNCEDRQESLF